MTSVEYFEELASLNCRSVSLRGAVKRMAVAVVHETVPEARLTSAAECVPCGNHVLRIRENGSCYDLDLRRMEVRPA